jgi:cation:H+ antiporter
MAASLLLLLPALVAIVAASELFTNALEHLGDRLRISEGVTGSVFAAVGTALPETFVPLVALLAGSADAHLNAQIGTGAIVGAPLMLSSLSTFLMACAAARGRGWRASIRPEPGGLARDLQFFLAAFALAAAALYVPGNWRAARGSIAALLVLLYAVYIVRTLRASASLVAAGHATRSHRPLVVSRFGLSGAMPATVLQLLTALGLLLLGTREFISGISGVSTVLGASPLLLSLLIVPVATELPEKINSIFWILRGKDTLAVGNITGAMVFQGTLLPAIGILMTPWQASDELVVAIGVTFACSIWIRANLRAGGIALWTLAANGAAYGVYVYLAVLY